MKQIVAKALAARVQSGQIIGIGSGSTVEATLEAIGQRIKSEKLEIFGVATSAYSATIAAGVGIKVLDARVECSIDWAFDGADEVDTQLNLIKGAGGAMLQEKILAVRTGGLVVLVTEEKMVDKLGAKFAVPVEVVPQAIEYVKSQLLKLGASEIVIRRGSGIYGIVITEQGNHIIDVRFPSLSQDICNSIKLITGVVECGLFYGLTKELLVAKAQGVFSLKLVNGEIKEEKIS